MSADWRSSSEPGTCILCGRLAQKSRHEAGGWTYVCSGACGTFAVSGQLHYLLEIENIFPPDSRRRIGAYLACLGLPPGTRHELTKEDINAALGAKLL